MYLLLDLEIRPLILGISAISEVYTLTNLVHHHGFHICRFQGDTEETDSCVWVVIRYPVEEKPGDIRRVCRVQAAVAWARAAKTHTQSHGWEFALDKRLFISGSLLLIYRTFSVWYIGCGCVVSVVVAVRLGISWAFTTG